MFPIQCPKPHFPTRLACQTHATCASLLPMNKINIAAIAETEDRSPKGKYRSYYRGVSEALGREPKSRDLDKRHPFDLEYIRLPGGSSLCPYHWHSAQWELYVIVSGTGVVREEIGVTKVKAGDAFIFRPGEAHQIMNESKEDLVYYVIADNPIGECCYYPDSKKWLVAGGTPHRKLVGDSDTKYYDGEE